jgi:hypothetical protein
MCKNFPESLKGSGIFCIFAPRNNDMKKETRQKIANISGKIDSLERTRELIKTSNVLCFTTMDRGPEETVSIEFVDDKPNDGQMEINGLIVVAKQKMLDYLGEKIASLNEEIDKIAEKDA